MKSQMPTDLSEAVETRLKEGIGKMEAAAINYCCATIHYGNVQAGWWTNIITQEPLDRNVGELLMLVVTEVSEAMEGARKDLMDDKLPHRKMLEVELADAVIRIFDIAGSQSMDLGGAIAEKLQFNAHREDHKVANRLLPDGKKF
jgi:NTP pyrophosphatase (non-canonical NTP hydrolase)